MESDITDVVNDKTYQSINFVFGDLTNYRSLRMIFEKYQFDGVFHLADECYGYCKSNPGYSRSSKGM